MRSEETIGAQQDTMKYIEENIHRHLQEELKQGLITRELFEKADRNVFRNLKAWLEDPNIDRLSPNLKAGIHQAVQDGRWADLVEAFLGEITFGTGGIRGRSALRAYDEGDPNKPQDELDRLAAEGVDARILKGPGTLNNIVLLLKTAGVAKYATEKGLKSVVIGFDSRILGEAFAELVAQVFLAHSIKVHLFDEAAPFPELTFATPNLKADIGILISASHNDKRYNGYKLTAASGAQFDINERNDLYENYIRPATTADIKLKSLGDASIDELVYLGGEDYLPGKDYHESKLGGRRQLINMHRRHMEHIARFIIDPDTVRKYAPQINVGFCAFHGAGRTAAPRLLQEFGFSKTRVITEYQLNELNGLFPAFKVYQQPDPGDPDAARIVLDAFRKQYSPRELQEMDLFIGTDPDADRLGVIIKVPEDQREIYGGDSHMLLDANDAWTILLWYRLHREAEMNGGVLPDAERKFIAYSHITTDALELLAGKFGLGVIKTWVGFAMLSGAVRKVWAGETLSHEKYPNMIYQVVGMDNRRINNVMACEQSNGFSILGSKPDDPVSLGDGHVRDKDGLFAAILMAEVAAYAKSLGKSIYELIDEKIYLDPGIGCFLTYYEPSPRWGQYEGLEGISDKKRYLQAAVGLMERAQEGEEVTIAGLKVLDTECYRTGKYDDAHEWVGFPDEGVRYYFSEDRFDHLTIRPSGTSQCLRFHVQLRLRDLNRANLKDKKIEGRKLAADIIADIRKRFAMKEGH